MGNVSHSDREGLGAGYDTVPGARWTLRGSERLLSWWTNKHETPMALGRKENGTWTWCHQRTLVSHCGG